MTSRISTQHHFFNRHAYYPAETADASRVLNALGGWLRSAADVGQTGDIDLHTGKLCGIGRGAASGACLYKVIYLRRMIFGAHGGGVKW